VSPVLPSITFQTSNYPNPFNPSTTIKYSLPQAGHLKLCIYNVRGQLVKTLIDGVRPAGADQTVIWDGGDNQGTSVSSGVYFYEARVNSEVKIGKMTLLK
jgi:flagellar hook assembly protein FlgD